MIKITAGIPAALATATFAIATPAVALAGTDTGPQTRVSAAAAEKAPSRTGTGPSATGPKPAAANSKIGSLNAKLASLGINLPK